MITVVPIITTIDVIMVRAMFWAIGLTEEVSPDASRIVYDYVFARFANTTSTHILPKPTHIVPVREASKDFS